MVGGEPPRKRLDFGAAFQDLMTAYGRVMSPEERDRRVTHVVQLLPSLGPLHELAEMTRQGEQQQQQQQQQQTGGALGMGDAGMVIFNDVFVAVPPTPATTTPVVIDGMDFDILDFGADLDGFEQGCTCTNCNYKMEAERLDSFAKESGLRH